MFQTGPKVGLISRLSVGEAVRKEGTGRPSTLSPLWLSVIFLNGVQCTHKVGKDFLRWLGKVGRERSVMSDPPTVVLELEGWKVVAQGKTELDAGKMIRHTTKRKQLWIIRRRPSFLQTLQDYAFFIIIDIIRSTRKCLSVSKKEEKEKEKHIVQRGQKRAVKRKNGKEKLIT